MRRALRAKDWFESPIAEGRTPAMRPGGWAKSGDERRMWTYAGGKAEWSLLSHGGQHTEFEHPQWPASGS